ncbi:MAG: hypothetical protein FWG93_05875 [Oscillospiraceae bacterium]|nr:hypothetical protein [Oscillospiraceae bacterium]
MAQKKAVIGAMAFLLVTLIVFSALALAAELGGKDDPLVSVSYLQGLEPQLKASIDQMAQTKLDEYERQLAARLEDAKKQLEEALSYLPAGEGGGGSVTLTPAQIQAIADEVMSKMPTVPSAPDGSLPSGFVRVDIPANRTVTMDIGAEFFLRTGTATVHSTGSVGLINTTTGDELASGAALVYNHRYVVTFDGYTRGFRTTASTIAFISGPYRISS